MSKKIRQLQEERAKALADARTINDSATGRKMVEDESRQYGMFIADVQRCNDEIAREEALMVEEQRKLEIGFKDDRSEVNPENEFRGKSFRRYLMEGMAELSVDERRALTAGSDVQGGFIGTPQEFVKTLIAKVKNKTFIRGKATVYQTISNEGIGAPTLDTDVDDAEWTTEVKKITEDDLLRFGKREIKPHPIKKRILVSDKQLRSEAMDTEGIILDRVSYKFGISEEKAYMTGSGNEQPLGLFTASAAGINTDRDYTLEYANDITADDLKGVMYNQKQQYMEKAEWIFNRSILGNIAKIKTGDGYYIFELTNQTGPVANLLGRPVNMSEYAPNTMTTGNYVGLFGDLSWYWICDSLDMRIRRLNELYAENSLVGFIFEKETDGAPALSEAFTRLKTGTVTRA